jgi:hypothetical protein
MNKILLLIFLVLSFKAICQEIKINQKFIIEFEENPKLGKEFKIVSLEPYDEIIESSKTGVLFLSKLKENQIEGVFAKGKFGNNIGTMLILKSGLIETISYELRIKFSNKKRFQNTSTSALFNNVKSIEYWPDNITELEFITFKKTQFTKNTIQTFEVKIDSTCLNNPEFNTDYGDDILKLHIAYLYDNFSNFQDFKLANIIEYEKTINSMDESPGNFYAFMENGGYVKKKKLAKPLSYKIIECPYFERETLYFYNKKTKDIKLVLFDWDKFEYNNFLPKTNYKQSEIEDALKAKHKFILDNVSQIFGPPLNEEPIKVQGRLETEWVAKNGLKAKTFLFIYRGSYSIRLYIYK